MDIKSKSKIKGGGVRKERLRKVREEDLKSMRRVIEAARGVLIAHDDYLTYDRLLP